MNQKVKLWYVKVFLKNIVTKVWMNIVENEMYLKFNEEKLMLNFCLI